MTKKKSNKKQPWSNSLASREALYKGVNPSADFDPISLGTQLVGYLGGFRTGQGMPEDEARWAAYLGLPYDKTYAPDSKIRFEGDEKYPDRQYQGLSKRAKEEVKEEIIPKARRIKDKYNKEWIQVLDTKPNSEYNDATIYHNRQNYLGDLGKFGIREVGNSGIYEVGDKYDFPALIPIPDRNEGTELMVRDTIWSDRANPKLYEEELLRRSNKHDNGGFFNKVRVIGKDEDLKQDTKDAIEWANNWYNARKATGKFDDQLVGLETLSNRPGTIRRDDYLQSAGKYEGSDASFSIRVNPNIPALWGNNKDYKSRLLHEIIHTGTTKRKNKYVPFESSPIFDIISDITGVPAVNTTDSQDLHQGLEYYPRLMQMRHEMNADPYKTDYTLPELKYWLKKYNLPADQRGVDMMNKIVYNDNPDVTYAKYGGRLNKYGLGGWFAGLGSKLDSINSNLTDKFFNSKLGKGLEGFGIKSTNIGGIANTAATAIGGLLAGKNTTGVGKAMQGIGSLASNIPGVGGLIGAGVNLAGGLVNAAFGSNLNQEFIDQTEQAAKQQASYVSSASTNAQLMSDYANMSLLADVNKDDVGTEGWFSNKATDETERLNALTDAANAKAMASIQRTADNIDKQNDLGLMANYTAYGGPINMKYKGIMSPFGNQFKDGGSSEEGNLSLEDFITQKINEKRAAALDKSRNRTSIRVPMVPNQRPIDVWEGLLNNDIEYAEESLSRAMAEGNKKLAALRQEELDSYLKEKDAGYPKLVPGANCMYNASDCYGLNIPGNQTFVAKHKELGFKKAHKGSMEPGDIVQDVRTGKPIHAMIYDSKDTEGNLLFNYAIGNGYTDLENGYVKQGKYPLPIKDYDIYKYVGTPTDSTQWINEYKEMYNKKAKGGPLKDSEYYSIMEKVAKDNYKNWGFDNEDEALAHALNDNTYNYRGYYSKYPKSKANADTHWTDEFKTVHHPTFSNESVYSGKKSKFNPEGLIGGSWDGETFIPADWQNKKAEGGGLFTNGVTTINNGGTHEENPYEGVQMGVDPQGIPNLVEEGEVIYDDYVYSNRLRVPKEVRQKYKLRGVTFADAAKQLQKESEERPNDSIAKNTLNSIMSELTQVQEEIRMKKNNNKYAKGGRLCNKFLLGGEPIIDNPYSPYASNNEDYSKWFTLDPNNVSKVTSYSDPYKNLVFTADMARAYAKNNANDASLQSYLTKGNKLEDLTDEDVQKGSLDTKFGWLHKARANAAKSLEYIDESKLPSSADIDRTIKGILGEPILNRNNTKVKDVPIVIEDEVVDELPLPTDASDDGGIAPMKDSWLRKFPIWMSGLAVANDLFGGNEPDYSNASMFERAIEGTNRPVTFTPLFDYMAYKPVDIERYKNRLDANAAASRSAIRNNSGGNRAAYLTGLLSSDYNYGNQLGELMGNIEGINYSRYKDMKAYNKATNLANAEMAMKADMANAEQGMQRARMYGSLAEYRDKILAANRAEKSANLTNFIQGLGDLGTELTDKDKLRWLADRGVLTYDPSGKYTGSKTSKKEGKKKKYGGKLNKKRGGFTI